MDPKSLVSRRDVMQTIAAGRNDVGPEPNLHSLHQGVAAPEDHQRQKPFSRAPPTSGRWWW